MAKREKHGGVSCLYVLVPLLMFCLIGGLGWELHAALFVACRQVGRGCFSRGGDGRVDYSIFSLGC